MATMASGLSPTNLRAICAAVPVLPWALWYCRTEVLARLVAPAFGAACTPSRTESKGRDAPRWPSATDFAAYAPGDNGWPWPGRMRQGAQDKALHFGSISSGTCGVFLCLLFRPMQEGHAAGTRKSSVLRGLVASGFVYYQSERFLMELACSA